LPRRRGVHPVEQQPAQRTGLPIGAAEIDPADRRRIAGARKVDHGFGRKTQPGAHAGLQRCHDQHSEDGGQDEENKGTRTETHKLHPRCTTRPADLFPSPGRFPLIFAECTPPSKLSPS